MAMFFSSSVESRGSGRLITDEGYANVSFRHKRPGSLGEALAQSFISKIKHVLCETTVLDYKELFCDNRQSPLVIYSKNKS